MVNNKLFTVVIFVALSLFCLGGFCFAQSTFVQVQDQVKNNTQDIKNIQSGMVDLKENYKLLYDGAKNQNDQLGNLISYSSYILAILGIIFAWYINRQYEKIKEMKDIVSDTKKYIDGHNKELYKKIKRDETIELLNRLKEVPEDVTNVCTLLLSRDLLECDYLCLKEPYMKIKDDGHERLAKQNYITLLMQHFPYQAFRDSDLRSELIPYISFGNMFNRDARNLFDQLFKYLKEFGISDEQNKTIIKNLFYHFYMSTFKMNIEVQNYIKELFSKHQLNKLDILIIAKEQASADQTYSTWLDSTFS